MFESLKANERSLLFVKHYHSDSTAQYMPVQINIIKYRGCSTRVHLQDATKHRITGKLPLVANYGVLYLKNLIFPRQCCSVVEH